MLTDGRDWAIVPRLTHQHHRRRGEGNRAARAPDRDAPKVRMGRQPRHVIDRRERDIGTQDGLFRRRRVKASESGGDQEPLQRSTSGGHQKDLGRPRTCSAT